MDMTATIAALLGWASLISHYPEPDRPPALKYEPHAFFVKEACGGQDCKAVGWYNDKDILYLDDRLRGKTSSFVNSLIVHELVHYLQDHSGKFNSVSCADQILREREAYAVQRQYVAEAYGAPQFQIMRPPMCIDKAANGVP